MSSTGPPTSAAATSEEAASTTASSVASATSSRGVFKQLLIDQAMAVHLPTLFQGSSVGMRNTLFPLFVRALGGSDALIGFMAAVAGVGRVVSAFPSGMSVTRFGFRETMSWGMYINCLGAIIAGFALNNYFLIIASFFFGIGTGAFFTSRAVMLAHIVGRAHRGRLMSLVGGGERWSSVIGPFFGGVLIDYLGNRVCSFAIIPVALLSVFCLRLSGRLRMLDDKLLLETRMQVEAAEERDKLIQDEIKQSRNEDPSAVEVKQSDETSPKKKSAAAPEGRDVMTLLRNYWHLVVCIGLYSMIVIILRSCRRLMLPLAAMNLGLSASMVGLVTSVSFTIDATLFFLGGLVMDKFGRRYSAIPTTLNLAIGFILLAYGNTTTTLFLVAMFFGFADSLGAGLLLTLNADHCPKAGGAEFMGMMRITQDMGQLVGPLIAGLLTSYVSFDFACWALGIVGIFNAFWAALMLPKDASDEDPAVPAVTPPAQSPSSNQDDRSNGMKNCTSKSNLLAESGQQHNRSKMEAAVEYHGRQESTRNTEEDEELMLRSVTSAAHTCNKRNQGSSVSSYPMSPLVLARAATEPPPPGHAVSHPASRGTIGNGSFSQPSQQQQQQIVNNASFTSAASEPCVVLGENAVVSPSSRLRLHEP